DRAPPRSRQTGSAGCPRAPAGSRGPRPPALASLRDRWSCAHSSLGSRPGNKKTGQTGPACFKPGAVWSVVAHGLLAISFAWLQAGRPNHHVLHGGDYPVRALGVNGSFADWRSPRVSTAGLCTPAQFEISVG